MTNRQYTALNLAASLALLCILAATLMPFFLSKHSDAFAIFPILYTTGAAALLLIRIVTPFKGKDLRLKRLHRIQFWSAVIFCVAAFFAFYQPNQLRDWLAFTLAGAVLQAFTSIAIPARAKKTQE